MTNAIEIDDEKFPIVDSIYLVELYHNGRFIQTMDMAFKTRRGAQAYIDEYLSPEYTVYMVPVRK